MRALFETRGFGGALPSAVPLAIGAALLAAVLHGAHLVYASSAHGCAPWSLECPEDVALWSAGDYGTYRNVARAIRARGLGDASYLLRTPGYPLLLVAAEEVTGSPNGARWLGPLAAALAAAAIATLTGWISGSAGAAALSVALFVFWWSAYQLSAALQTDGLHAFGSVVAVALTMAWRVRGRVGLAVLAGLAWMLVQSLRPTFFAVALLLPLIVFVPAAGRRRHAIAGALLASTLIVPALVTAANWQRHGVAVPSLIATVNLRCYAVPRLEEELGLGVFKPRRERCLERFRGMDPAERVRIEREEASAFFAEHPFAFAASIGGEIAEQLGEPLRMTATPTQVRHYPDWMTTGSAVLFAFWLLAAAATLWIFTRQPWLGLFLVGWFALVMLPASTAHFTGGRLRFPLDLLAIPVVAAALTEVAGWLRARYLEPHRARKS
ncbi:MAG: hypothetical protein HRU01_09305 [Myxococcales bacterium]|nr:hypothetical protein [Myxococcales bacterium]